MDNNPRCISDAVFIINTITIPLIAIAFLCHLGCKKMIDAMQPNEQ